MSFAAKAAAVFSLRRISGQIAAVILVSLIIIHGLIGAYFFLSAPEPQLLSNEPIEQFGLFARLIAQTPPSDQNIVFRNLNAAFPELSLRLRDDENASVSSPLNVEQQGIPVTFPFAGNFELIRGASRTSDRVRLSLPGGQLLEATIGGPKLPPFVGGLLTSTLLFLLVSITLLGVWTGRALSSPLSAFARAAEEFSLNQASAPLPEIGSEEIRAAAKALNRMQERIRALINDRTRMLAAISHDLRTPITRLRLRAEYIDDQTHRVQTLRDLDQMQGMLESVLILLRGGSRAAPTFVDIAALLQMVCHEYSDYGHTVAYDGPRRATLTVRPDEIRRAVSNLVENAVRFGSEVTVSLATSKDQLTIEVADDGPGIPEEQKPAMLEPFVRGEDARTMDATSGFGLGLSIAQATIEAHGGRLSLHANDPHGLVVRLLLPRAADQAA